MNRYMDDKWIWIEGSHGMRDSLLAALTDADLTFTPGGQAMTLGALITEMGDVQKAYIDSLKTAAIDFSNRSDSKDLDSLKAWFQSLDADLKAVVSAFSDDDLTSKAVDRGGGFLMPVEVQLEVYLQALLIFFGKASIYLRVMNKPLPDALRDWIW